MKLKIIALAALLASSAQAATVFYAGSASSGSGDGSSWANRMAWADALAAAVAVEGDAEVRVTGDVEMTAAPSTVSVANSLVVRGGFSGDDENPEARGSDGAMSTFSGGETYDVFVFDVSGSLEFENVAVTRGKTRGVDKTGSGPVTFRNCSLSGNGRTIGHNTGNAGGCGLRASGAGVVTLSGCEISGNGPILYPQNRPGGWGVYVMSAQRVFVDDCRFVTNGVWLATQSNGWGTDHRGLALYLSSSPATLRNTLFAGNISMPQGDNAGGTVYFGGAAGESAMTNCTFSGNQDLIAQGGGNGGGICIFQPSSDDATLDVSGCTFAYNLTKSHMSAAGLSVRRGRAHVVDSTFFHNVLGYADAHGWGSDVSVHGSGSLSMERTLLSSLAHSVTCENAANLAVDAETVRSGDPGFATGVLDVEALMTFGTELSYTKSEAVYTALAALDLTPGSSPAKPDVGDGSVLYVKGDAAGAGDGSSWADAFATLDAALAAASAKKNEIWIAGDLAWSADAAWTRITDDLAVRGGFAGTEADASERVVGARSALSGGEAYDLVRASVASDRTLTFERVEFARAKNRGVEKRDCGSLAFSDCVFMNNGRTQNTPGKGVYATAAYGVGTLAVSDCRFEGQMRNQTANANQSGSAVFVAGHERFACDGTLFASNGTVVASSGRDSRGTKGAAVYGYGTPVTMRRVRFAGNVGASRQSDGDGGIAKFEGYMGASAFTNCAFVGNYAFNYRDGGVASSCGALVLVPQAADTVDVENCTFAYNLSQGPGSPGALNVHNGAVNVHNSIFWHNVHGDLKTSGIGSEIEVKGGTVSVSHSILTGTTIEYCHGAASTSISIDEASVYTDDPGFVTPFAEYEERLSYGTEYVNPGTGFDHAFLLSLDAHLLSPQGYFVNGGAAGPATSEFSRAIDSGDPATACVEPAPNGGRVNLGAYGNTDQASLTPSGTPKVEAFSVEYRDGLSRPYATLEMGIETGTAYLATVTVVCTVNGVEFATKTFNGVMNGDVLVWGVPRYFEQTDTIGLTYRVEADGATAATGSSETSPTGKSKAAFCGRGGGEGVVHVREGADCMADGSDWEDAYPTLAAALAAGVSGKSEVWIARETEDASADVSLSAPLAIRGGFAGTEDSAAERADGTRTTFACGNMIDGFSFDNAAGATLELDRLAFVGASQRAVKKTGAGDLVVRDCRFGLNGRSVSDLSGKGLYLSGGSASVVTVTNCVFDGNMVDINKRGERGGHGAAVYAEKCARLTVDDSLFVSNGMQTVRSGNYYVFFGAMNGSALYASATPVTMRRSRVAANALGSRAAGGAVYLSGDCGGSAFTNCAFVGNYELMDSSQVKSNNGGAIVVDLGAATRTCELENCTIAYNVTDSQCAAGGINVLGGAVTVRNCVVWGNYRNRYRTAGYAEDIEVKGGSCSVSHTLLTGTGADKCRAADAATLALDENSVVVADPLFVSGADAFAALYAISDSGAAIVSTTDYSDLAALDVHLLSSEQYWLNDGTVGPKTKAVSPAIDAGDRSVVCVEPSLTGGG